MLVSEDEVGSTIDVGRPFVDPELNEWCGIDGVGSTMEVGKPPVDTPVLDV